MEYIPIAKNDPIGFVNGYSQQKVFALLSHANDVYRNTKDTVLTDDQYDTIYDLMKERNPQHKFFKQIGNETEPGKETKLPYHMGGMDKFYSQPEIDKWLKRENTGTEKFVISDKLDGNSGILIKRGNDLNLYSRGNGTTGRDISHLIPHIGVPDLSSVKDIAIRGELIVSREDYAQFSGKYKNPRNFANSMCVAKDHPNLNLLNFVAFDLVFPTMKTLEGFRMLESLGFKIPQLNYTTRKFLNCEKLKSLLEKRKETSSYEMDGLIITRNGIFDPIKSGNPKHSVAFKVNSFGEETVVKAVDYQITKYGRLIPLVRCEPVIINGASVSNVTGNNAKFIVDNRVNVGTRVRIILSGEIIPKMVYIQSDTGIKGALPKVEYNWDATNTHVMYAGDTMADIDVMTKRIVSFIKTMKIDCLSYGIVKRLIENGYSTLDSILTISPEQLLEIDGFKDTLSSKIVNNIRERLDNPVELVQLMSASLAFGDGMSAKRLKSVVDTYPDILDKEDLTINDIKSIRGFSDKTALAIVDGLKKFREFLEEHPYFNINTLEPVEIKLVTNNPLVNKTIVLTGIRDPTVNTFCETISGCKIGSAINSKVDFIVVPNSQYSNKKTQAALELGIVKLSLEEFKSKFMA